MNIDLNNKVMTYTHLSFGGDGANYVYQTSKKIKYKITLPDDEGSRVFFAWSAVACAQTLQEYQTRDIVPGGVQIFDSSLS